MDVTRYKFENGPFGYPRATEDVHGGYVGYGCYTQARGQQRMALALVVVLALICAVLSVYLAYHTHDTRSVASTPTMSQQQYAEQLEQADRHYQAKKAEVEQLQRRLAKTDGKLDGLMKLNANLAAQIKAQNVLLSTWQQTEVLNVATVPLPAQAIEVLAQEVGFSKVKVGE